MVGVEKLATEYGSFIRSLLLSSGIREADVDDEQQEFYLSWFTKYGKSYDEKKGTLRNSIFSLIHYRSLGYKKSRKRPLLFSSLNQIAGWSKGLQSKWGLTSLSGEEGNGDFQVADFGVNLRYLSIPACRECLVAYLTDKQSKNIKQMAMIFDLIIEGRTLREIATEVGYSLCWVHALVGRVKTAMAEISRKKNEVPLQLLSNSFVSCFGVCYGKK